MVELYLVYSYTSFFFTFWKSIVDQVTASVGSELHQ